MRPASPFSPHEPDWLAHRHVESDDAIRFIHVPRDDRGRVPFLTDAKLGDRPVHGSVPVGECIAQFERPRLAWIFHSAFCGSTLLAQAFNIAGTSSSLSEPVLLNDLVGLRRRGAPPTAVARLADAALRALGRPYPDEAAVIIKPSNVVNPLAELLLALQPSAPAVFLYAPLQSFLLSVARKGLECRLWARELLQGYLREDFIALGFSQDEYFRQTDLQVAAMGWLAQHGFFMRLAEKLGPQRLRTLDAERMLTEPELAMKAVADHFVLGIDAQAVAAGPVFRHNSKSGESYSAEERRADYAAAQASYGEEIDAVLLWTQRVAQSAGLELVPPASFALL